MAVEVRRAVHLTVQEVLLAVVRRDLRVVELLAYLQGLERTAQRRLGVVVLPRVLAQRAHPVEQRGRDVGVLLVSRWQSTHRAQEELVVA